MSDDQEKPKIIIDEDWKAQVEREREQARQQSEEAPAEGAPAEPQDAAEGEQAQGEGEAEGEAEREPSPFEQLISSLATQCLMSLGLIAPQGQQQVMVDLGYAKYVLDTLDMLKEKTAGNLTEHETAILDEAITELKRAFQVRAQQAEEQQLKQQGVDLNNLQNPPNLQA